MHMLRALISGRPCLAVAAALAVAFGVTSGARAQADLFASPVQFLGTGTGFPAGTVSDVQAMDLDADGLADTVEATPAMGDMPAALHVLLGVRRGSPSPFTATPIEDD